MTQILLTILFSSVKFAMTFPVAILQFNLSFLETVIWTNVGGVMGIYFFAFLSEKLILWWNRLLRKSGKENPDISSRNKKIFTKKNRRIVRIKQSYGLIGIALTTPVLLSIPVGVFLVVRYYRNRKTKLLYLFVSNVMWSMIYSGFYLFWDQMVFTRS